MLAPWKKSYDQPRQHIKSRDITLPTKVRLVKAMVFPVVMYGCKSWTLKKAEHQRIDAFELWCWRRLLRVPWTARRWNLSILKEINPEYSLEGLMLKLKLQYFGYLMWRTDSLENTLMLGKRGEGDNRGWDGWMASLTQRTWIWVNSGVGDELVCCSPWGHKELDTTEWLNWTEQNHQKLKEARNRCTPRISRGSIGLLMSWFQTYGLCNSETINFCCFKPLSCW